MRAPAPPAARGSARALATCGLALALSCFFAIVLGTESVSLARALEAPGLDRTLLVDVRAPRVALAAVAGAALSVVGAAYQALLRNPLAEPFVLGVSGGAALGASAAIALGLGAATALGAAVLPLCALFGGLVATALVAFIARGAEGGASGTSILLAGVMVNAIAASLVTFLKTLVAPSRAQALLRWLVGFVDLPSATELGAVALYVAAGTAALLLDAGRLNLLALGDDAAASLGVDVRALERRVFVATSCLVGAVVSLTGLIGFVGLVVPHAVRRLAGPDQRLVLPASAVAGAAALVLCDLGARLAFRLLGSEPPVGAVTAIVFGPMFLVMLKRSPRP
jgi:iron complex transport system permease protein